MLTCITYIEIQQNASKAYPARAKKLFFDFANELEADDGWDTLTDKAKIGGMKEEELDVHSFDWSSSSSFIPPILS